MAGTPPITDEWTPRYRVGEGAVAVLRAASITSPCDGSADRSDGMAQTEREQAAQAGVQESVRAWWSSVLTGDVDQEHPVRSGVSAQVKGAILHLHGSVT